MIALFIPELLQVVLCQVRSGSWKHDQASPRGCAGAWLLCGPSPAWAPLQKLLLEEGGIGIGACSLSS